MTNDFRFSQGQTNKIIASGSSGTSTGAKLVIYPITADETGTPNQGYIDQTVFATDSIGSDIFLFVSGGIGEEGTAGAQSITAFGGDVHISGNLTIDGTGGGGGGTSYWFSTTADVVYTTGSVVLTGSFTEGWNNYAIPGVPAHAEGNYTAATNLAAHSEGEYTAATGEASHVEGWYNLASGLATHAEGLRTTSSFEYAHSEGESTVAQGRASHTEGSGSVASGWSSHAEGYLAKATGDYSHAEGSGEIIAGDFGPVASYIKAIGSGSHAEGFVAIALGNYSHAEGRATEANGTYSHAEGWAALANGPNSHAEGRGRAYEVGDHAEGNYAEASGSYSHAEGMTARTYGIYSHAEGTDTVTVGESSHAEGRGTISSGSYQLTIGQYNKRANDFSLFVVGDGTGSLNSERSDIIRVNSGSTPGRGKVEVTGSIYSTISIFSPVVDRQISVVTGALTASSDQIIRISTTASNTLILLPASACSSSFMVKKTATGSFTVAISASAIGELIEGTTGVYTLSGSNSTTRPAWQIWSDGSNWWIA